MNGLQNFLVFQPISRYFTTEKYGKIRFQSKGIAQESITLPSTTGISFKLEMNYTYGRGRKDFKGVCFK